MLVCFKEMGVWWTIKMGVTIIVFLILFRAIFQTVHRNAPAGAQTSDLNFCPPTVNYGVLYTRKGIVHTATKIFVNFTSVYHGAHMIERLSLASFLSIEEHF